MMKEITLERLEQYQSDYMKDPLQRAVRRALYQAPLFQAATVQENEGNLRMLLF